MLPHAPPFLGKAGTIVDVETTAPRSSSAPAGVAANNAQALVASRVRVKWKGTGRSQWYSGIIVAYDARKRVHKISYDDGEVHDHHLEDLVWALLPRNNKALSPSGASAPRRPAASATPDSLAGEHVCRHVGTVEGRDLFQEHTEDGYMSIISSPACTESQATLSASEDAGDSSVESESHSASPSVSPGASPSAAARSAPPVAMAPPPAPPRAPSAESWKDVADGGPAADFTPIHKLAPGAKKAGPLDYDEGFEIVDAADAVEIAALATKVKGAQIE